MTIAKKMEAIIPHIEDDQIVEYLYYYKETSELDFGKKNSKSKILASINWH